MNNVVKLAVITLLAVVAYQMVANNGKLNLSMIGGSDLPVAAPAPEPAPSPSGSVLDKHTEHAQLDDVYSNNPNVLPHPQMSNNFSSQGNFAPAAQQTCFPQDQLVPTELLPVEGGFADSNPAPQGQLSNRNFFESGHHPGLNTQSSTLKNANLQLRSDPLIPRRDVGPWHQSTYEADTNRRQFDIGGV